MAKKGAKNILDRKTESLQVTQKLYGLRLDIIIAYA